MCLYRYAQSVDWYTMSNLPKQVVFNERSDVSMEDLETTASFIDVAGDVNAKQNNKTEVCCDR